MTEFQREVAEVQWLLDKTRRAITFGAPWAYSFPEIRVRGKAVQMSDLQLTMFRRGVELWPARIRAASRLLRVN